MYKDIASKRCPERGVSRATVSPLAREAKMRRSKNPQWTLVTLAAVLGNPDMARASRMPLCEGWSCWLIVAVVYSPYLLLVALVVALVVLVVYLVRRSDRFSGYAIASL